MGKITMQVFQIQNYKVNRLVSVFDNHSDKLISEHSLASFDLSKFKQHFQVKLDSNDSEMVLEYEIESKDVEFLSEYLAEQIDYAFDSNSYFLSCYQAGK